MPTSEADKLAYCGCMDQVSRRLRLIRALLEGRITTGDESADTEIACLQARKALEQVAYASLAASREAYAKLRPQFEREWSATRILERLDKVHPDFYPLAVSPVRLGPNQVHFELVEEGFLTRDDFVFLYDKCSDAIHDWNPYREGRRVVELQRPMAEWAERIEKLLAWHRIRLIRQTDILAVQLCSPSGRAHVFTASPIRR